MWIRQIIFLSFIALTIGLLLWRNGRRLYKEWKKSEAMVIRNNYVPSELRLFESIDPVADETGTYYAVIEFKTDKGETITEQLEIGTNPPRRVGQRVSVIYNPSNPTRICDFCSNMVSINSGNIDLTRAYRSIAEYPRLFWTNFNYSGLTKFIADNADNSAGRV